MVPPRVRENTADEIDLGNCNFPIMCMHTASNGKSKCSIGVISFELDADI